MLNKLPLTKIKITIAKVMYKLLKPFLTSKELVVVKRNGINYELDLTEGIDFSLFLFGNFQRHVTNSKHLKIPGDALILDIGGNFGVMALQYAQKAPQGEVISFEPTHYAISRFKRNLELNPDLSGRIKIINSFVSCVKSDEPDIKAYSSWKIDGKKEEKHPVHWGTEKPTSGVGSIILDEFCDEFGIKKIDLIKVDTDGHEFEIFKGAKKAISKYQPQIVFEVGKYVMIDKGIDFMFYLDYFSELNYELIDTKTNKKITETNWNKIIPDLGTTDVIAIPGL